MRKLLFFIGMGTMLTTPAIAGAPTHLRFEGTSSDGAAKSVVLVGVLYKAPVKVLPVPREKAGTESLLQAAAADLSAERSGDREWILENWLEAEKGDINTWLQEKEFAERNQKAYMAIQSFEAVGYAYYQDFAFLLMQFNQPVPAKVVMTFKKTPFGWRRTHALSEDETENLVFHAFSEGHVTAQPAAQNIRKTR